MAKKIKISATRINTFLQCKQKYCFNYIDKIPKLSNPVFKLGLAVHEALELAGNIWKEKERFSRSDTGKILTRYKEVSVQEGIEDLTIHIEGIDMVKKRLKDFVGEAKSILGLEIDFGFKDYNELVTPQGVPLIGAIDKVLEIDEDTILIIDYKTSKTAPTPDQLKNDKQLSIYDLVGSIMWPDKRIIVSLDLLRHDIAYSYRTPEEREEFDIYLKIVYGEMCNFKKKDAKATIHQFCPWCDFREQCTAYKEVRTQSGGKFLETHNMGTEELFNEWKHVKSVKKIFEERDKELSMIIMEKIKESGENFKASEEEVYIRQNARKTYDLDVVHELVPSAWFPKLVNLNAKKVASYIEKNPAIKARVLDKLTVNYTSPFLATKKVKK